jgi:hypothetical protein
MQIQWQNLISKENKNISSILQSKIQKLKEVKKVISKECVLLTYEAQVQIQTKFWPIISQYFNQYLPKILGKFNKMEKCNLSRQTFLKSYFE